MKPRTFTDKQLIDLHAEGLNDREKAERLGVSRSRVRVRRRRLGIESIRSDRSRINHQRLHEFYEGGLNDVEIAERLGVKDGVVFNYRKKLGLKPVRYTWIEGIRNRPGIRVEKRVEGTEEE